MRIGKSFARCAFDEERTMKKIIKMAGGLISAIALSAGFASAAIAGANAGPSLEAALGGDMNGIVAMSDAQLAKSRGGFGGISFSLIGYGDISSLNGGLPDGVSISSQSADLVSLQVGLATLPNTGGFIQFASIVGNNNVINHTLNLNVYIIEGGVADTSGFASGQALGF
jgi:hypothetical protein